MKIPMHANLQKYASIKSGEFSFCTCTKQLINYEKDNRPLPKHPSHVMPVNLQLNINPVNLQ